MKIGSMQTGDIQAGDAKFAVIACRFNGEIVNRLLQGATDTLLKNGATEQAIDTIHVPGAFELPLTALQLAETKKYAAIIALSNYSSGI